MPKCMHIINSRVDFNEVSQIYHVEQKGPHNTQLIEDLLFFFATLNFEFPALKNIWLVYASSSDKEETIFKGLRYTLSIKSTK